MKKLRKLTLLTLALSLVLCLTGCDLFGGGVTKQDAVDSRESPDGCDLQGQLQGYLDLVADFHRRGVPGGLRQQDERRGGISDELSGH